MNKKFLFFLILSLCLHIALLVFVKIKEPPKTKEKPVFVDIIRKKKKPLLEKKLPQKKILSEENEVLKKRGKKKKTEEIPTKKKRKPVASKTRKKKVLPIRKRKQEAPKKERKKIVKEGIGVKKKKTYPKKIEKKIYLGKKEEERKEPVENKLTKEQIEKILNPTDILSKYVKESDAGSKKGEDDVDVAKMKFKYASYFRKFERRLYQVWHYPKRAALRGEEGVVKIKFTILKDGTITNIRILQSSGYPMLDREAVRALKTMKGVPLPDSYGLKRLKVTGYFSYRLNYMVIY